MQFNPELTHIWLSAVTILILQGIALYTWQFRREPGARWQSYLQVCKGFWLLTVLMIPRVQSTVLRDLWHGFYTVLALMVCYIWIRGIGELSGFERRFAPWFLPLARALLLFFILADLTNPWHHWYWTAITIEHGVAHIHTAPLGYAAVTYAYLLIGYSLWINILWARHCTGLRRRQAYLFILPTLCAWTGQFLGYLPHTETFEPHTLGFLAASLLMARAFLRWRTYSILPLAQKAVVEAMIDGLLIVDSDGYIVELNEHAREMFHHPAVKAGGRFQDAVQAWPVLERLEKQSTLSDATLERDGDQRSFMVVSTPLRTSADVLLGSIVVFKEVTIEKRQQEWILEQNRALTILQERERLGRELHDGPGQLWSFLSMQSQAARLHLQHQRYEQADHTLEELQQVVKDSYISLRESINALHSDLSGGMLKALSKQLQWYREHCRLETRLETGFGWQEGLLNPRAELQVLRILQEALANSRKSAHCTQLSVAIRREPEQLVFEVADDGIGFDPEDAPQPHGKHGLRIMQDRAREIGARLVLRSSPGTGCHITLTVPLHGVQPQAEIELAETED